MDTVKFTLDGVEVRTRPGRTVLEAALENGIYIPHLCYHPELKPAGACRLCLVDVGGRTVPSCLTPAAEGTAVRTDTPEVVKTRRVVLELILAGHKGECLSCGKNTDCELQKVSRFVGIDEERFRRLRRPSRAAVQDLSNPFFVRDPEKCVLCGICVRTCEEIQGVSAIDYLFRGYDTVVGAFGNKPLAESRCESCGECVVRCPVGALAFREAEPPSREVKTVCPYCGCGCGILLGVRGDRVVSARGDAGSPVSRGQLCVKGRFGHGFLSHPDRLKRPMVRKNGKLEEVGWDEALAAAAEGLSARRGRTAVLASSKCTNEEVYLAQKFARVALGTNHIDNCARL